MSRRFRIRLCGQKSPFCSNFYGPYSSFVSLCMTRSSSKCRLSSKNAIVHMHSKKQTGDTFSNARFRLSSEYHRELRVKDYWGDVAGKRSIWYAVHLTSLRGCAVTAQESDVLCRFRLDGAGTSGWSGRQWCWPFSHSICRCIPGLRRLHRERVCPCRLRPDDGSMWCWSKIGRSNKRSRSICSKTSP